MTNTNDIVREVVSRARFYVKKLSGPGWLMPNTVDALRDCADLIEQQDKDITAMAKLIGLQETKINELERAIENETVIRTGYKSRINELEAEVKSLKPDADMYRFYYS